MPIANRLIGIQLNVGGNYPVFGNVTVNVHFYELFEYRRAGILRRRVLHRLLTGKRKKQCGNRVRVKARCFCIQVTTFLTLFLVFFGNASILYVHCLAR